MFVEDSLTEDRWLDARSLEDAAWMVRRIWQEAERPSARKTRLFVCACARQIWHLLTDERCRQGVEVAERFLEGLASLAEVTTAAEGAWQAYRTAENYSSGAWACVVAVHAARTAENRFDDWKAPNAMRYLTRDDPKVRKVPATLLRDIIGNPFRPVAFDSGWITSTIRTLATAAYEERELPIGHLNAERLAVLSDALEEAGCIDRAILDHLRAPSPHVRGCWAVDLLLAKEEGPLD